MVNTSKNQRQLICTIAFVTIITQIFGLIQPSFAATSSSQQTESAAASTQPLWSYQVKPNNYMGGAQSGQNAPYSTGPSSIFDAFTGLSQRQGALTSGSPFLTILPIILIAAGGLLLLLPMLTMMMASPFGGGAFGGGYQNYGYPQVGLNKRRSLDQMNSGSSRGIIELIEHVSSTIEDLSRKYSSSSNTNQQQASQQSGSQLLNKRSKALNGMASNNHQQQGTATAANSNESPQAHPANHKQNEGETTNTANSVNNLIGLGQ